MAENDGDSIGFALKFQRRELLVVKKIFRDFTQWRPGLNGGDGFSSERKKAEKD